MKVIINDNQRGLLFRNGVLTKILGAGKYSLFGGKTVEALPLDKPISSEKAALPKILALPEAKELISEVTVKNGEVCLHYVDGVFAQVLTAGRHAFWNDCGSHEFKVYSTENPRITDIPEVIFNSCPNNLVTRINVRENFIAAVKYNGKIAEYLGAGSYFYWWNGAVSVTAELFNLSIQELEIKGQEILTKDKVGVRVNFSVDWKITDYKKIAEEYTDFDSILYSAVQLALRDYLGGKTMDELLSERENIGAEVLEVLKKRAADMPVEILSGGIKDIILPGEIAAIMNSVLAAEKRAQANVITRREEVASTRSLLNTAKLMDENATLRRLKELEYIEKICGNIGEITVDARSSLLSQLAKIIGGREE